MNILWISFYGSWTEPLLNAIKNQTQCNIYLIIPEIGSKKDKIEIKNNITHHSLALEANECYHNMSIKTFYKFEQIIKQVKPDIIHIHGTEKNLAQIQNYIQDIPIVISIQGILKGCKPHTFNFINKNKVKRFCTLKNILGWGGINLLYKYVKRGETYETDILKNGKYFIGRTSWDKAYITFHNPTAYYFQGEELLRNEFYQNSNSWDLSKCQKHTILMPSGFSPNKGLHLAVKTIQLLKIYYKDIKLYVPGLDPKSFNGKLTSLIMGEEYLRYVKSLIKKNHLQDNIIFLPQLNTCEIIEKMKSVHVFLSPSSIENSSNIIGEATIIGTPIVTTPVGGIISFMKDNENSLFAPAGDAYMMAYQIKNIFENDSLAFKLSQNAYQLALTRHDKEKTAKQYIKAYQEIIKMHLNKKNIL